MSRFPDGFLWGVSTSAHQFEGGNIHNQWHEWEKSGRIRSGDSCSTACGWWTNAERDLDLCAELGLNTIRVSVDWGRLEPYEGAWNEFAFDRYRKLLEEIHARNMRPFVTLHHFTHPTWFENRGAFLVRESAERFAAFASKTVHLLGDLCTDWLTFNEPNVYAIFGYVFGEFPPGERNKMLECARALSNTHRAHALAYDAMHSAQPSANIGITINWVDFCPASQAPTDRLLAYFYDAIFNRSTLQMLTAGNLQFPFGALAPDVPEAIRKTDFIGVNVYNRLHVRAPWNEAHRKTGGIFVPRHVPQGDAGVDLPYGEACPDAVTSAIREYSVIGVPIYVMENGVPDRSDRIRPWVIVQTLKRVGDLIASGHDIRGYFHWSIVDNFEWNEGWTLRFGLYELDLASQQRKPRPSADIFRQIIAKNEIADELLGRFSEPPISEQSR